MLTQILVLHHIVTAQCCCQNDARDDSVRNRAKPQQQQPQQQITPGLYQICSSIGARRFWLPDPDPPSSLPTPLSFYPPAALALQTTLDQHPPSLQSSPLQHVNRPTKHPQIQATSPTYTEQAPALSQPSPHPHDFGTQAPPHGQLCLSLHYGTRQLEAWPHSRHSPIQRHAKPS